jgi:hypothetical protein
VRISHLMKRSLVASLLLIMSVLAGTASAQSDTQTNPAPRQRPTPPTVAGIVPSAENAPGNAAGRNELYCGGFIQYAPAPNNLQIVGGVEEQQQFTYTQGNYVYINAGTDQNIRVGQEFSVIRPRGQFRSKLTKKSGWLGVYTQELGQLRVVSVKERVSVAVVTFSCEMMLLGDLLRDYAPQRVSPKTRADLNLDRFSDPNGKQNGRIVLARDLREAVTRNDIVFIDLGTDDQIKPGDYFTIYRPVGKGNVTGTKGTDEISPSASGGFQSDEFRGGKFSSKASRVEDPNNTGIYGPVVTTTEVKGRRPKLPRKVVGELVVLSVQKRTATAVITRIAQEVHTGDFVELQ